MSTLTGYPRYWWSPGKTFIEEAEKEVKGLKAGKRNGDVQFGRGSKAVDEAMDFENSSQRNGHSRSYREEV